MIGTMNATLKSALTVLGLFAMLALVSAGEALAQDGKALFSQKGCVACHGADGKTTLLPVYPKLAGQNADYLVAQLKDFKSQARKSGQSALMWGMAAQLSEAEMKAVAAYLSKVK